MIAILKNLFLVRILQRIKLNFRWSKKIPIFAFTENQDFKEFFLPLFIAANFEVVSYNSSTSDINIYLDEKPIQPADDV